MENLNQTNKIQQGEQQGIVDTANIISSDQVVLNLKTPVDITIAGNNLVLRITNLNEAKAFHDKLQTEFKQNLYLDTWGKIELKPLQASHAIFIQDLSRGEEICNILTTIKGLNCFKETYLTDNAKINGKTASKGIDYSGDKGKNYKTEIKYEQGQIVQQGSNKSIVITLTQNPRNAQVNLFSVFDASKTTIPFSGCSNHESNEYNINRKVTAFLSAPSEKDLESFLSQFKENLKVNAEKFGATIKLVEKKAKVEAKDACCSIF